MKSTAEHVLNHPKCTIFERSDMATAILLEDLSKIGYGKMESSIKLISKFKKLLFL